MAKNDYYSIVAKILVYLYKKYKQMDIDPDYILPMTVDFPIKEAQLFETIDMMVGQGLIKAEIIRSWSGEIVWIPIESMKILPAGIDYLQDNIKIRQIIDTLKEAKAIYSLFQ